MTDYIIATDATIDLDYDILKDTGACVIPMSYIMDDDAFDYDPSKPDFDFDNFFEKLAKGAVVSTSQVTPASYIDFFGELIQKSKNILYICFSSGLSGTYNSACFAAEEIMEQNPDVTIKVIDSLCASVGEGLIVYLACNEQKAGKSFEETVEFVEKTKTKCQQWFVVGSLDQLKRGGRISSIEAALGTMLHIHPILKVDGEGRLEVAEKVRGMKKAFSVLNEKFLEIAEKNQSTVMVGYAGEPDMAEEFAASIKKSGIVRECLISHIGPVIGSHTGAPMYAIVFLSE